MSFGAKTISRRGLGAYDSFLLVGQSNAVGDGLLANPVTNPFGTKLLMLGNDYHIKRAYEPTDDSTYQVDSISNDTVSPADAGHHSPWLALAKYLHENAVPVKTKKIMLIPCAKGSTVQYAPGSNPETGWQISGTGQDDRATLFGSAYTRLRLATAARSPKAILVWGFESSSETDWGGYNALANYVADWTRFIAQWRSVTTPTTPVFYFQLGPASNGSGSPTSAFDSSQEFMRIHLAREAQRRCEGLSGTVEAIPNTYMVPTYDLAIQSAGIHVDRNGQATAAQRMGAMIRKYVYGESLDAAGPRVRRVKKNSNLQTDIVFDKELDNAVPYFLSGMWGCFDSVSGNVGANSTTVVTTDSTNDTLRLGHNSSTNQTHVTMGYVDFDGSATSNVLIDDAGNLAPAFTLPSPL